MKQLVLKVPTIVFATPVLVPLLIVALQIITEKELMSANYLKILKPINTAVALVWLFSIVDYFRSKAPDFKYIKSIYLLLFIDVALEISDLLFFQNLAFTDMYYWAIGFLQFFNFVAFTILLTLLIQKVFYERSTWFIVLEILTIIVGILTLTPEIKRNEQ